MSNENDERNNAQNAMLGWLIAPLAILLALLADYGLDFGLVLEMKEWNRMLPLQLQQSSVWHLVS